MQAATTLAIGTTGITVPRLSSGGYRDSTAVKPILRIPTLNACVLTFASSDDGGTTWMPVLGFLALTLQEPQLTAGATAAGFTGNVKLFMPPCLPGTMIRATSSVSQADKSPINVYFAL